MSQTIELFERVDKNKLYTILMNLEKYGELMGGGYVNNEVIKGEAYYTILKKYFDSLDDKGFKKTFYRQRSKLNNGERSGRFFADGSLSLQNISRQMRHTIGGDYYHDLDIVNAHPIILQQICRNHNIPCENLDFYISNREELLCEICQVLNVKRDVAKKLLLEMINGSQLKIKKYYGLSAVGFLKDFYDECMNTRKIIQELYPKYLETSITKNSIRKKDRKGFENVSGTCLNLLLCFHENNMLQIIIDECRKDKIEPKVLAFDGLMISNEGIADNYLINTLFPKILKRIKDELGFNIKLSIKKPDEGFIVDNILVAPKGKDFKFKPLNENVVKYWKNQESFERNEIINERYINSEFYSKLIGLKNLICVRGNMNTSKTYGLKKYCDDNPNLKVLLVTYRISLDEELARNFGFDLYSDFKESFIQSDRLVCQIDSLKRVIGDYDVVIVDEAGYTLDHFINFVKDKHRVLDSFIYHLTNAKNVIACDALFKKRHFEMLNLLSGKTPYIVENTCQSYNDYKVTYMTGQRHTLLNEVLKALKNNKKIVLPSNSRVALDFIKANVENIYPDLKICLIDRNTEIIETHLWVNYDLVMYTPSIESGVSLNVEHFDIEIAYMTNKSSSPCNFTQMLFRNRKLRDKEIIIVGSCGFIPNVPIFEKSIISQIREIKDVFMESGLKINYSTGSLDEKDLYYNLFMMSKIGDNMDRTEFKTAVMNFLKMHGLSWNEVEDDKVMTKDDMEKMDAIKGCADGEHIISILDSENISEEVFKNLEKKKKMSKHELLAFEKYKFLRTYRLEDFSHPKEPPPSNAPACAITLFEYQDEYRNVCLANQGEEFILKKLHYKGNVTEQNVEDAMDKNQAFMSLIDGRKQALPTMKLLFCMKMIKAFGTDIKECFKPHGTNDNHTFVMNYAGLVAFLKKNPVTYKTLVKSKFKIDDLDATKKEHKRGLFMMLNSQMKSLFGIKLTNCDIICSRSESSYTSFTLNTPLRCFNIPLHIPYLATEELTFISDTYNGDVYEHLKKVRLLNSVKNQDEEYVEEKLTVISDTYNGDVRKKVKLFKPLPKPDIIFDRGW